MIIAVQTSDDFRKFVLQNGWLHFICLVIALITMCVIICTDYGRRVPHNYILCAIFTTCEGYAIAGVTAVYEDETVILAGLETALVSIALTIYAMYSKTDISVFMGLAFVAYFALLPIILIGSLFMSMQAVHIVYCVIGLILYSLFLIIDTKMICDKGKTFGNYDVSYDDYIICAM